MATRMTMDFNCTEIKLSTSILIPTTKIVCSSLTIVPKNAISIAPLKCTLIYVGAKVWMSTKPFALLETSTTSEIIIVLKITSMLVGCDSSVTTESSTIFPPSLCSSLLCTKFGCRSKVGLHFVEIEKGHHQMRHYLPVGFQT